MQELVYTVALFAILQLINVILNTTKTLIMTRTDSPHMSAAINAITFGFYTAVVKQIATLDLSITIVVVVITNIIGVYLTYYITNRLKKDNLWKIEIYSADEKVYTRIARQLKERDIAYAETAPNFITAYCYTQAESTIVKDTITGHNVKYNITEIIKRF